MLTLTGGQTVQSGTYWDIMNGARIDMDTEGALPGGDKAKYIKASPAAVLLTGPILGLIYIVALPIMGVVTALGLLLQKTLGGAFNLGKHIVTFGWRPAESYLGGKTKKNEKSEDAGKPKS